MKVSNTKCKLEHQISTMVICGSYMFEFNASMNMKRTNNDKWRNPKCVLG